MTVSERNFDPSAMILEIQLAVFCKFQECKIYSLVKKEPLKTPVVQTLTLDLCTIRNKVLLFSLYGEQLTYQVRTEH